MMCNSDGRSGLCFLQGVWGGDPGNGESQFAADNHFRLRGVWRGDVIMPALRVVLGPKGGPGV